MYLDSPDDNQKSGFFKLDKWKSCSDPSHNPPTHIHVPAGQGYRHVCPRCGNVSVIHGQDIICG
ncbi:hypothetical protein [Ralstonia phage RP13]|nr:hypothetical protein [Ralstonia phage RP13]